MLQSFIETSVDYLIADSLFSRDCAKEALGQELHPRLYAMLFRRLNLYVIPYRLMFPADCVGRVVEDVTKATNETDGTPFNKEEEMLVVFFEQVCNSSGSFIIFFDVVRIVPGRLEAPCRQSRFAVRRRPRQRRPQPDVVVVNVVHRAILREFQPSSENQILRVL